MAVWTEELNTNYNFPHIDIFNRYKDGVLANYRATPQGGYVMYDRTANDVELDPDTMEEIPVIYYRTTAYLPLNANFDNFIYVAVLRSEVDENYIFGGGNDNEVM